MDDSIKHRIKQQYNRLSALLVFIANAFTLMYVGGMAYNDALWFGSVSGAFTYTILSTIADSQDLEDLIPDRRKKPTATTNATTTTTTYGTNASRRLHQSSIGRDIRWRARHTH